MVLDGFLLVDYQASDMLDSPVQVVFVCVFLMLEDLLEPLHRQSWVQNMPIEFILQTERLAAICGQNGHHYLAETKPKMP